jgi:hypothetical protein
MLRARPSDLSEEFSRQRMHDAGVVLTATNTLMAEIAQNPANPLHALLAGFLFCNTLLAIKNRLKNFSNSTIQILELDARICLSAFALCHGFIL